MMLNTDMCLAMNGNIVLADMKGSGARARTTAKEEDGEPLLADQHNCCAWMKLTNLDLESGDPFCGGTIDGAGRGDNK